MWIKSLASPASPLTEGHCTQQTYSPSPLQKNRDFSGEIEKLCGKPSEF
jgi:hypothetical protein